jgi:hypothetical protein
MIAVWHGLTSLLIVVAHCTGAVHLLCARDLRASRLKMWVCGITTELVLRLHSVCENNDAPSNNQD